MHSHSVRRKWHALNRNLQRLKYGVITDKLSVGTDVRCGKRYLACDKLEISRQTLSKRLSLCHR